MTYLLPCLNTDAQLYLSVDWCKDYRQYCVFVDNKDAQHAESDRFTIHAAEKYIHLYTIYQEEKSQR